MVSFLSYVRAGVVTASIVVLAGCATQLNFPNTPTSATQSEVGSLQGSNYGGHAPLVGAHVYLVQPGTTGYGSVVTGLLRAGGSASYPTTMNGNWTNSTYGSDQFVPTADAAGNAFYGVTTNSAGEFNLTGDYTCTAGQPVFLIGYGGNPSYAGTGPNVFSVSTEETYNNGSTGVYLTYTTTASQLFYVGESVTVSGSGAAGFNQTGTVLGSGFHYDGSAASLTTTSFSIFVPYNGTLGSGTASYQPAAYGGGSVIVTGTPTFNPAAVNLAMLGICPSSGNFSTGASAIKYIYMNEVSTAAFAYAMNQYANWSVDDQHGNDEFHIGSPSTTQALQGIANASIAAANLYDIQGSSVGTANDGDGHIARAVTASGAGIVPQAELDTIANILAACVDSNNTYRLSAGTKSTQCQSLGFYASDNGVYDTTATTHQAFNIVQAALNIAHYPQGAGTGTTTGQNGSGYGGTQTVTAGSATSAAAFVSGLFNLPTGNVPFVPQLSSAPNDFSVGINWQTSPYAQSGTKTGSSTNLASVGEVAIDTQGNAWIVNNVYNGGNDVLQLSPSGSYKIYNGVLDTAVGTTSIAGLAIDRSNNVLISSTAGVQELTAASGYTNQGNGPSSIYGYVDGNNYLRNVTSNSAQVAIDSSNYLYVANLFQPNPPISSSGSTTSQLVKMPAVSPTTATFTVTGGGTANTASACASYLGYLTLDGSGNIWTSNQAFGTGNTNQVCKFSNSGTLLYSNTTAAFSHMIAVDAASNAWWVDKQNNTLIEATASATSASGVNGTATTYTPTAGVLNAPRGIAVDGANTLWVTSGGNGGISRFSTSGSALSPTYYVGSGFDTVTGGGTPSANFAVIDQSGNLWSADTGHGEVIEWVGVAAPTVQPLAQQRAGTAASNGHGIGQMP